MMTAMWFDLLLCYTEMFISITLFSSYIICTLCIFLEWRKSLKYFWQDLQVWKEIDLIHFWRMVSNPFLLFAYSVLFLYLFQNAVFQIWLFNFGFFSFSYFWICFYLSNVGCFTIYPFSFTTSSVLLKSNFSILKL